MRPESLRAQTRRQASQAGREAIPATPLEAAAVEAVDARRRMAEEHAGGPVLEPHLEHRRAHARRVGSDNRTVAPEQRAEDAGLLWRQDAALARTADSELSVRRDLLRRRR